MKILYILAIAALFYGLDRLLSGRPKTDELYDLIVIMWNDRQKLYSNICAHKFKQNALTIKRHDGTGEVLPMSAVKSVMVVNEEDYVRRPATRHTDKSGQLVRVHDSVNRADYFIVEPEPEDYREGILHLSDMEIVENDPDEDDADDDI